MGPPAALAGDRARTTRSAVRCTAWTNAISGALNASGRRRARGSATSARVVRMRASTHISKTVTKQTTRRN